MEKTRFEKKISKLPQCPGIYFFMDKNGKILYIGKATNLKSRVQSYFRNANIPNRPIEAMIHEVAEIKHQETDSVLEALILEANLIKKYQPKYNVKEKDDKSFSYFVITKEDFSRVLIMRGTDLQKNQKSKIKNQNDNSKFKNLKFIRNSEFEIQNSAIYGPYTSKKQMQIALKIMRKIFPFHSNKQKTEKGCLDYQIGLCPGPYEGTISKEEYRKNIRGIEMILEGKKKRLVTTLEKEMKKAAKRHEFEKAAELRNRIFALNHIRDIALITLEMGHETWNTEQKISHARIEAYDISNISGTSAVGSMIVFKNGQPDKSQYRKFKIKAVKGSDDVGMMKEVLSRRFSNDWEMPDLVLLDGGQGHFNMAKKLLHKELGLAVAIASVAKGPTRKKLELLISDAESIGEEIKKTLADKKLLKQIMDEAHRFAITFHRKVRKKNAMEH